MYRLFLCVLLVSSVWSSSIGPAVTVNVNLPSDPDSSFVNSTHFHSSHELVCGELCPRLCKQVSESLPRGESSPPELHTESQYVSLTITYNDNESYLEVIDAVLDYGKWTDANDCSQESAGPNRFRITKNQPAKIRACGRANSPSGTEGSFILQSNINGVTTRDAQVKFDVPYIGSDKFELKNLNPADPSVLCVLKDPLLRSGVVNTINCYKLK